MVWTFFAESQKEDWHLNCLRNDNPLRGHSKPKGGHSKFFFVTISDIGCFQSGLIKSIKELCLQINAFVHTDLIYITSKTLNNGHTNAKQINFSKAKANTTIYVQATQNKTLENPTLKELFMVMAQFSCPHLLCIRNLWATHLQTLWLLIKRVYALVARKFILQE